ncbi:hypothetical protein GpartN1_g5762.t1 [Galdieria partita]|uniref:Uncharacterized protein n=1 Tax=Galdieria partita TaxID=83374 RepID=A0A9C7Q0H7_9RHOD|nr:hypothetical protein GpartN1_g5762.t1 [Galdieria partita]
MVAMLIGCFAFSFHSTCLTPANVQYPFQTKVFCGTKECHLWSRSFTKPLSCFDKKRPGFGCRRVVLASVINGRGRDSKRYIDFREIFIQDDFKIDEKFSNVWLTNLPDLQQECLFKTVASVVGEKVQVGGQVFKVGEDTFEEIASLLVPKQFPKDFPVQPSPDGISRVFLRQEFIKRWNGHIESLGGRAPDLPPQHIIVSAASGLGKSVDLYLAAVFSRYCRIPLQYIGNAEAWLGDDRVITEVVPLYLKMLLFMNSSILDELRSFQSRDYEVLNGAPLKHVIYFCIKSKDLNLAFAIRRFMMLLAPRNMLIVDEHNALWSEFGNKTNTWPNFFRLYTKLAMMNTPYCGVLIAGSQHHQFEDNLPSGSGNIKHYLEPLSFKEFDLWQDLPDYPPILRQHSDEMVELTGLVPRMIAKMVTLAKDLPDASFEYLQAELTSYLYSEMTRSHNDYLDGLRSEREKRAFDSMLYKLFMDRSKPNITVADGAYRDRGLLVVVSRIYLRFYNSVARDILLSSFLERYASENYLAELFKRYRSDPGTRGQTFEKLFFLWFINRTEEVTIRSDSKPYRNLSLSCNSWVRLVGDEFDPPMKKFTHSCWILLEERHPRFDYIFVDIVNSQWHIYFFQVSISSFYSHNRDSAAIENSFLPPSFKKDAWNTSESANLSTSRSKSKQKSMASSQSGQKRNKNRRRVRVTDKPQLLSLIGLILNEEFTITLEEDDSGRIVDFRLLDSKGVDWRHCISIVYVTPLPFKEAKGSLSVPDYIEFLCSEGFSERFRVLLEKEK